MARGSTVLSVALLILTSMTVHCAVDEVPCATDQRPGAAGALVGTPDPRLIPLLVRANLAAPPRR